MRNLAIRLVLWLCARFDIVLVGETRTKNGADAVERGQRWERFANEEGGLFDMIDQLRREAFEAAAETPPEETDKLAYWAMCDRNLRKVRQSVMAVIQNGRIEADRIKRVERNDIARMGATRR